MGMTLPRTHFPQLRGMACVTVLLLGLLPLQAMADKIRIAVASNFAPALADIAKLFEQQSPHKVLLSSGSTGKHYAQIINGAPFDLFFAADTHRPELLDVQELIVKNSRFTYAQGRLVLWNPLGGNAEQKLHNASFERLAIANPRLAPYGRAAQQTLQYLGLWQQLQKKLVRGENISQAYQFTHSGSAQLGLVALAQLRNPNHPVRGSTWLVPENHYAPIRQQAVQLSDNEAAGQFLGFIKSPTALAIIERYGYGVPR